MNEIKTLRQLANLTQKEVAELVGMSLRSYKSYENEKDKENTIKYKYILRKLTDYTLIDENHGILKISDIEAKLNEIFSKYDVEFCYLFGSYAKGYQNEKSDVDLLISTSISGLKYYEMVEDVRQSLNKNIDILDFKQVEINPKLLKEILKDGIKIYG